MNGSALLRAFFGALVIWSAVQSVYLSVALVLTSYPPTTTAELVSIHLDGMYAASLWFHLLCSLCFGLVVAGPEGFRVPFFNAYSDLRSDFTDPQEFGGYYQIKLRNRDFFWVVVCAYLTLWLVIAFVASAAAPRYEVFTDLPDENIIKRDIHLLPPGMNLQEISFGDIERLIGGIEHSAFVLYAVTEEG